MAHHLFQAVDANSIAIFHSCYQSTKAIHFSASVLKDLLTRLVNSYESLPWHALVLARTKCLITKARLDTEELQAIVERIISNDQFPSVSIIIDALSCCRGSEVKLLINCLQRLAELPRTRVIVLTHDAHAHAFKPRHLISMNADTVGDDVQMYTKARINRTEELQMIGPAILQTVSTKSSGMFLYSILLLDELERAATSDDCVEILDRAPYSLTEYFNRLWADEERNVPLKNRYYRMEIFQLLVAARTPLHVDTIRHFIALDTCTNNVRPGRRLKEPRAFLEENCRPFISFNENFAEIAHPSMETFIRQRVEADGDPDARIAEQCLSILSNARYASPAHAASSLRRHLLDPGLTSSTSISEKSVSGTSLSILDDDTLPYDYAVLQVFVHMFAVRIPSDALLNRLADFITNIQVVSWSERLVDLNGNVSVSFMNTIIDIRTDLRKYIASLPSDQQDSFPLKDFFIAGHEKLRLRLVDDDEGNHLHPFLPSLRLGQWYSISQNSYDDQLKAYENKELVVDGFTKVLGKRTPFSLEARTSWVNEFWFQELILEAVEVLADVVKDYQSILLGDGQPCLEAIQNLGLGQYFLTDFTSAIQSLEESGAGLFKIDKEKEWVYQVNNLYQGWVLERQGALEPACEKLESVLEIWGAIAGESNGLCLLAKTTLGSVHRKLEDNEKAIPELQFAWKERCKLFTINNNSTVDSGLHLAIALREADRLQEAEDMLDQLSESSVFTSDFVRQGQVVHIWALIAFDRGDFESPKNRLIQAVNETTGPNRNKNNREYLWIRTTAADVLRFEKKDREALMLFTELVGPLRECSSRTPSPTLVDEPEPPSQLAIAEQALRLVKGRDQDGAEKLLNANGLTWVRQKDFWIPQGGPAADTGWMKPPNLEGFVKVDCA